MYFLLLLAAIAGAILPVQAGMNARMGRMLGDPALAALLSFTTGGLALLLYCAISRVNFSQLSQALSTNWYVWLAGPLGAFYVTSVIHLVPRLGTALTFSLVVAGQLFLTLLIDHYGMLGVPVHSISWPRIAGVVLILAGVLLIRNF